MDNSFLTDLSRRERQIMDIIFKDGPMNAQEIMDQMPDAPGYATVRKILGILEEKGHVKHQKSGRQFIYESTTSKEKVKKGSLKHTLSTFFKGSITDAVATFLDGSEENISDKELDELEDLIRKAKEKKNNS